MPREKYFHVTSRKEIARNKTCQTIVLHLPFKTRRFVHLLDNLCNDKYCKHCTSILYVHIILVYIIHCDSLTLNISITFYPFPAIRTSEHLQYEQYFLPKK